MNLLLYIIKILQENGNLNQKFDELNQNNFIKINQTSVKIVKGQN